MLDHHALGAPGGARSVDDVAEVARPVPDLASGEPGVALRRDRGGIGVEAHQRAAEARMLAREARRRHQYLGLAVPEDERHAVHRIFGIEGDVGGPGLEDSEQGGVGVRGSRQKHGRARAPPHPACTKMPGEAVGPLLELEIRESFAGGDHGEGARAEVGPCLEDLVEWLGAGQSPGGAGRASGAAGKRARRGAVP